LKLFTNHRTPLKEQHAASIRVCTASVKGRTDGFTLKGGDATNGTLDTMYDGPHPHFSGYQPSKKQGAIILATGTPRTGGVVHLRFVTDRVFLSFFLSCVDGDCGEMAGRILTEVLATGVNTICKF
jgi:hypothetical protein